MYQCKHFVIQELVPPHVYEARKEKSWELLDVRALRSLDTLRGAFGRTVVNNWHIGGSRKWSGLRTAGCPQFSEYSQHTFGRAFDCIFMDTDSDTVRNVVLLHKNEFPEITALETNVDWFHFDVRNCSAIKLFDPIGSVSHG